MTILDFLQEYQSRVNSLPAKNGSYIHGWSDCIKDMVNAAKKLPTESESVSALTEERDRLKKPQIGIYTSAIIQRGDKFLLTRHIHIGEPVWLMPGGKPDPDETGEQCLIRECREELAIEIEECEFHGAYLNEFNGREWIGLFYRVRSFKGEPIIQEPQKHSDLAWLTAAEMREIASKQPGMGIAKYLSEQPSMAASLQTMREREKLFEPLMDLLRRVAWREYDIRDALEVYDGKVAALSASEGKQDNSKR